MTGLIFKRHLMLSFEKSRRTVGAPTLIKKSGINVESFGIVVIFYLGVQRRTWI